ncbi:hypothetical protein L9F63_024975, partial [Diploptera punctata]
VIRYILAIYTLYCTISQVGNVITNRNANRLEFERLLDGAKTYMRHHKVPGGMKRRVLRWYDYSWSRGRIQGGGDINTALGLLPDKLKTELALHVNLSVLKKVTIFQECQPEFLHDLVLKMKAYIFTPGDLICRKGEVAREMFIIADGILEVISETGRVLTTMKVTLNLSSDTNTLALIKLFLCFFRRTADVRSVGYSELFSLSREDVLAAMKDYPEAQEILQSLGRKRLMEARNVSRTKSSHHDKGAGTSGGSSGGKDGATVADGDGKAGKRIVEKLRSDVKGLKNVLRKSRRGTRTKEESMELQPLNPGSVDITRQSAHSSKGVLRRMSRVRSDENYSREESLEDQPPTGPTAKIGEGLPLLQRLRLLKEKQDREERGKPLLTPTSPPPASATLSPPPIKVESVEQKQQEPEVIGAGLPLIQRLLLLKQKEERERLAMQATAAVTVDVLATTVKSQQEVESKTSESCVSPPGKKGKGSASDDSRHSSSSKEQLVSVKHKDSSSASAGKQSSASSAGVSPQPKSDASSGSSVDPCTPTTKVPLFREKLKLLTQKENTASSSSSSSTGTVTSPPKVQAQISDKSCTETSSPVVPVLKKQHSWSLLKKASILSTQSSVQSDTITENEISDTKRTASTEDTKVHDKSDSDHIPSKPITSEKMAKLTGDISVPQSSKVQDKLKTGETQVIAQGEGKSREDNKQEESKSQVENETSSECPKEKDVVGDVVEGEISDTSTSTTSPQRRTKPNLLRLQKDTKFYQSIDDLSPEYSGLPFVKKLKILNERQKLAELEQKVAHVLMRSSSLDSGNTAGDPMNLTRSHSEASAMQKDVEEDSSTTKQRPNELPEQSSDDVPQSLTSPESNETLERRNLKSILKKLSASSLFSEQTTAVDMRKLMRAPTIEGYAARHSKLTKSVTFNRDTLQSPPATATTPTKLSEEPSGTLFPLPVSSEEQPVSTAVSAVEQPKMNFFRPSLLLPSHASLEEEYFNEVIIGIKQVIQGHLEEIQNKFQTQFQSLELEVKRRDEIITQLQKRIHELEHPDSEGIMNGEDGDDASEADDGSDQPFMRGDSVDTVLASPPPALPDEDLDEENDNRIETEHLLDERPYQRIVSPSRGGLRQRQVYRRSWEDHSEEETMELLDLPRSISPQSVWCAENEEQVKVTDTLRDCVAVELGSSDSSSSSSSSSSSDSSNDEDDAFGTDYLQPVGHNRDWEVQMLARELDRREDISRLEDEVREIKAAVSSSDLSLLSSSELDILEQVLVAKDRKVRAAARAISLDSDDSYSDERSLHPSSRHKPEIRSASLSSSLNRRRISKQRSTNGGGSIENLLYKTSILKNRLLSATTRRHQLLNARSLDETPEPSHTSKVTPGEPKRNRSASSGSITPVVRPPFALPSASGFMRGLGNLVRTSSASSTCQTSHHVRQSSSSLESAGSDRATVPTISRSCREVSPDPNQHTNDPPPPDL